jgi:hypothetical protein
MIEGLDMPTWWQWWLIIVITVNTVINAIVFFKHRFKSKHSKPIVKHGFTHLHPSGKTYYKRDERS